MTPYIDSQRQAIREAFRVLETAVTQPIGLTYDLRSVREALFPDTEEKQEEETISSGLRERVRVPLPAALETAHIIVKTVENLHHLNGLDPSWATRALKVLARVEHRLGVDLRAQTGARVRGLYVILDPQAAQGRDILLIAEAVLKGGARVLQLRDKMREKGDQMPIARKLLALCREANALFVVNDHADLAVACGADGLHLGQHDLPSAEARQILSPGQLMGRSNSTLEEAMASQSQGADYVAVGAVFSTASKEPQRTRHAGLETLKQVKEAVAVPVVAIGGINEGNVGQVLAAGADAVAVISAVVSTPNPEEAARRLSDPIEEALARRAR
ncbi:MAG: thiamine phosphate synthase [Chloroflexi bacterium]|nr:thiamine phosphate synthase [Chloroflexota bacterium]